MTSFDINNLNNTPSQPVQSIGYTKNIPIIRDKVDLPPIKNNSSYISEGQMANILAEKGINSTKKRLEIAMALYYQNQAIHEDNIKYMEHMSEILKLNSQDAYEAYILLVTNSLEVTDERIEAVKEIITNKDFVSDLKSLETSINELNTIIDHGVKENIFVQKENVSNLVTTKFNDKIVDNQETINDLDSTTLINNETSDSLNNNNISNVENFISDKVISKNLNQFINTPLLEDNNLKQYNNLETNKKDIETKNIYSTKDNNINLNSYKPIDNKIEQTQKSEKIVSEQILPKEFKTDNLDLKKLNNQIDKIISLKKEIFSSINNNDSSINNTQNNYIGPAKFSKPDNFFDGIETFEGGLRNFGLSDDAKSIYNKNDLKNNDNPVIYKNSNSDIFVEVQKNSDQPNKTYKVSSDINNLEINKPFLVLINGIPKLIEKTKTEIKILQSNLNITEDLLKFFSPKELKTVILDGKPNLFVNNDDKNLQDEDLYSANKKNDNLNTNQTYNKSDRDIFTSKPIYNIQKIDNKNYLVISENANVNNIEDTTHQNNQSSIDNNIQSKSSEAEALPLNTSTSLKQIPQLELGKSQFPTQIISNNKNDNLNKILIKIDNNFVSKDDLSTVNTNNFVVENNLKSPNLDNDFKIIVKDGISYILNTDNKELLSVPEVLKNNLDIKNLINEDSKISYVDNNFIKINTNSNSEILLPASLVLSGESFNKINNSNNNVNLKLHDDSNNQILEAPIIKNSDIALTNNKENNPYLDNQNSDISKNISLDEKLLPNLNNTLLDLPLKINQIKKEVFIYEYSQVKQDFKNTVNNIVDTSENIPAIINNIPVILNKSDNNNSINIKEIDFKVNENVPNYLEAKIGENTYTYINTEDNKSIFVPKYKIENSINKDLNNLFSFKTDNENNEKIFVKGLDNNNYVLPKSRNDLSIKEFSNMVDNKPIIISFDQNNEPVIIINKSPDEQIEKPVITNEKSNFKSSVVKTPEFKENDKIKDLGFISLDNTKPEDLNISDFVNPINFKDDNDTNNQPINKLIYSDNKKIYSININKAENLISNNEINRNFNKNNILVFNDQIISRSNNQIYVSPINEKLFNKAEPLKQGLNITQENGILFLNNNEVKHIDINTIQPEISLDNEPLFFKVDNNTPSNIIFPNKNKNEIINKNFIILKNPEDFSLRVIDQERLFEFGSETNFENPVPLTYEDKKGIVFKNNNDGMKFLPLNNLVHNSEKLLASNIIKIDDQYKLLIPDKDGMKLFNIDNTHSDIVDNKLKVKIDGKTFFVIPENETGEHLIIPENPSLNKIKYDLSSPIKAQLGKENVILHNQNNKLNIISENKAALTSELVKNPISTNINSNEYIFINVDKKVYKLPVNNKVLELAKNIENPINLGNLSFIVFDKNLAPKIVNIDSKNLSKADKLQENFILHNETGEILVVPDKNPKIINTNNLDKLTKFSVDSKDNLIINNEKGSFILNKSHVLNNQKPLSEGENITVDYKDNEYIFINGKKNIGFVNKDLVVKNSESLENIFIPKPDKSNFIFKDKSGQIKNAVISNHLLNKPEVLKEPIQISVDNHNIIMVPKNESFNIINTKPEDKIDNYKPLKINVDNKNFLLVTDDKNPILLEENSFKDINDFDFSKPIKINVEGSDYVIFKTPEDNKIKLIPINHDIKASSSKIDIDNINDFQISDLLGETIINTENIKPSDNKYNTVLTVNNGEIILRRVKKQDQNDINIDKINNQQLIDHNENHNNLELISNNGLILSQVVTPNIKLKDININQQKDNIDIEPEDDHEVVSKDLNNKNNIVVSNNLSKYDVKISIDSLLNSVLSNPEGNKNAIESIKGLHLYLHKDQENNDEIIMVNDENSEPLVFNIKDQNKQQYVPEEKYTFAQNLSGKESLIIKADNNTLKAISINSNAFDKITEPIIDDNGDIILPDKNLKSISKLSQNVVNSSISKNIKDNVFIKSDNLIIKENNSYIKTPINSLNTSEVKENTPFIAKIDGKENIVLNHKGNLKQIHINYLSGNIEKLKDSGVFNQDGNTFLHFKDNKNNVLLNIDKINSVLELSDQPITINNELFIVKNNKIQPNNKYIEESNINVKTNNKEININNPLKANVASEEGIVFNDTTSNKIKFISNKDVEKYNLLTNKESVNTGSNSYVLPRKDDLIKVKLQDNIINKSSSIVNPKELNINENENIILPDNKTNKYIIVSKNEASEKSQKIETPFYLDHENESYLLTNSKNGFKILKTDDLNNKTQKIDSPIIFEKDNNIYILKENSSSFSIDKSILDKDEHVNSINHDKNIDSVKTFNISDKPSNNKNIDNEVIINKNQSYIDKNTLFFKDNTNDFIVEILPKKEFVKSSSNLSNISINGEKYNLVSFKLVPENKNVNQDIPINKPIMINSDFGQGIIYTDPLSLKVKFINIQDLQKNNINNLLYDITKNEFITNNDQNSSSNETSNNSLIKEAKNIEQNIVFNNSAVNQIINDKLPKKDFDSVTKINYETSGNERKEINFEVDNTSSENDIEKMSFNGLLNSVLSGKDEQQKKVENIKGLNFFVKTGDENENKSPEETHIIEKNTKQINKMQPNITHESNLQDTIKTNKNDNENIIDDFSPIITYGDNKKVLISENGELKSVDLSDQSNFKKINSPIIVNHNNKDKILTIDNKAPIIIDIESINTDNISNNIHIENSISHTTENHIDNKLPSLPEIEIIQNDISKTKNIINNIVNNNILSPEKIHHVSTQISSVAMMYGVLENQVKNLKSELKDFKNEESEDSDTGLLDSLISISTNDPIKKNDKKRTNDKLPFETLLKSVLSEVYSKVEKINLNLQGREILSNKENCFCIPLSIPVSNLRFNGEIMVKQELDSRNTIKGKKILSITLAVQTKTLNTVLIDITNLDRDLQVSLKVENKNIKDIVDEKLNKLNSILKNSSYNVKPATCIIAKNTGRGNSLLIPKDTFPKSLKRIDGII